MNDYVMALESRAIARKVVQGVRTVDTGAPFFWRNHERYIDFIYNKNIVLNVFYRNRIG